MEVSAKDAPFQIFLQTIPNELHEICKQNWQQYSIAASKLQYDIPMETAFLEALWLILAMSDFAANVFIRHVEFPERIYRSLNEGALSQLQAFESWQTHVHSIVNQQSLINALRLYRQYHLTRILWRDLNGLDDFEPHLSSLCALADTIIQETVNILYGWQVTEWGRPQNDKGEEQPFLIVALGKLGGSELNFSSDIDLMFTYPQSGMTVGQNRSIANEQFFIKLGQQFIKVLTDVTPDGFVYRVDMRLRPNGQSGSLVMNFSALENYYQYQGRDWERYALIKARVVTPKGDGEKLLALLQPFIYRRYLDYGAFSALRDMKDLVDMEVKRRNKEKDLKLGKGGIRQIEFLAQAIQLIRGGREPQFREQNLLKTLKLIANAGYVAQSDYQELKEAYIFLRKTEHRIQMVHDAQCHALPKNLIDRVRLTYMMGFNDEKSFRRALKLHNTQVVKHFNLIAAPKTLANESILSSPIHYKFLWSELLDKESAIATLQTMGYLQAEEIWEQLRLFKQSRLIQSLKKQASARLNEVVPALLVLLEKESLPLILLERMLRLMRAIVRRSAYLALLNERPQVLKYLVNICGASEWILMQICSYPVLLDELLSPPSWEEMTSRLYLEQMLADRMKWIDANDLESQMEHLRQFKLGCFLSLAALELLTEQSLDIAMALSDITEVILTEVYYISLEFMLKHYEIQESLEAIIQQVPFGIVAYGKLGERELNYASDLDLVFLFDAKDESKILQGKIALTPAEFSLRLAQRIIHMLNVPTATGVLYEVDVRLRPGGSAGLLVSSLSAYKNYLEQHAWTWELQALVKARAIIGPISLQKSFEDCRAKVLKLKRSSMQLTKDIEQMREKMHDHRPYSKQIDLKSMTGGIADIEFIVQYIVLKFAHQHPQLLSEHSTVNLLPLFSDFKLLEKNKASELLSIYSQYQVYLRRHILQSELKDELPSFVKERQRVQKIWEDVFQAY
jgi:glutamate-ammonia-ligase adenylyltransferase